jgi:hypothetical protein
MKSYVASTGACLVFILAACGGRVGDGGGGGGGGGSSSGGASSGGGGSSGASGSNGGHGVAVCNSDADCGAGSLCGFPESEGCSAVGTCFPSPGSMCELYAPGCACDGTTINIACTGLPDGYAPRPLEHTGECAHPTPPIPCTSEKDCPVELVCAFPIAQGCAAQGVCLMRGAMCNMPSQIGCACDGQDVAYGTCSGLPNGYAPAPLLHDGLCDGVDAGTGD